MGKKKDKATESSKKARKALKEGLAKPAIEVSPHALDGEDPQFSSQLDALRESDIAAGMNEKAARVQRQQRLRKLKKGETLPAHGGLNDLQEPDVVEPVVASDTESESEAMTQYVTEAAAEEKPLSKKERKALAKQEAEAAAVLEAEQRAAQERAEADRRAAEKAAKPVETKLSKKEAKKLAKQQAKAQETAEADRASVPAGTVDPAVVAEIPELPKREAPAETGTRRDNSLIALQAAQAKANDTGKKQKVVMPRKYKTKNYGNKIITSYTAKDPNLVLQYTVEDSFDEDTGYFTVTITVLPSK